MAQNLRHFHKLVFNSGVFSQNHKFTSHLLRVRLQNYSKFTTTPTLNSSGSLNPDTAYELIVNLSEAERTTLKNAMEKLESNIVKQKLEGELAATRWRVKFARVPQSKFGKVDPTGAYCAMPDDWLQQKAEENAKPPESNELWKLFFVNLVPFLGFGFLDNFIMIVAGDSIDHFFGTVFCFSTMAAAGFGNTISDVLGIGSAHYIERACEIMGLTPPKLSNIQMGMTSSRKYASWGRIVGISVGCIVGMFPLLFMENKRTPVDEEESSSS